MGLIVLVLLLSIISQPTLGQSAQIALFWQDQPVESIGPQIKQGTIYIPIKVMEYAGAAVHIGQSDVRVDFRGQTFEFFPGETDSNGSFAEFEGEYYLSSAELKRLFNLDIQWNSSERKIVVKEPEIKRQIIGLDFDDSQGRAVLKILHQGKAEYQVTKLDPGRFKIDLFRTTLAKPLGMLLMDHPLVISVRAEQLSRDQVTFYIQGREGLAVESRLDQDNLLLEFFYTVESFEYRKMGGLPMLFYQSQTGLPEYREYLDSDLRVVREFMGVKLLGEAKRVDVNDDLIDYYEYFQDGPSVVAVMKIKPALQGFFSQSVQGKRLAQILKIRSEENDIGTEILFEVMGNPYARARKEGSRVIVEFSDTQANSVVRDLRYTSEYSGLTLTKLTDDSINVEILLKDAKGYALTQKDEYTYSVQLVKVGLQAKLVVIDPGHGGYDPGATGVFLEEKDLNLDVAFRLRDLLENLGYMTILTRETDLYVSLSERTNLSRNSGADLFVSVHTNGSTNSSAKGIETYYAPQSSEGKKLAESVQKALIVHTQAADRSAKDAGFWVLVNNIPRAILVEIGFVTNPSEEQKLNDENYRQKIAEGICSGIISFMMQK